MRRLRHILTGRLPLIGPPYLWLLLLFLIPFLIVLKISFSEPTIAIPPYSPNLDFSAGVGHVWQQLQQLSFENYNFIFQEPLFYRSYTSSLTIAGIATLITLAIGYPLAYAMARAPRSWRAILLILVILPFWTSFLIRVYAWIGILKKEGLLNQLLLTIGVITEPLTIINTNAAVYVGIVYSYLPFLVLPLYASLERMDGSLLEAAQDLGCTPFKAFWTITFPISLPGVAAGCFLVFIPAVGEFVIPDLLGGSETLMIGRTLWVEFFNNRDWPVASAVAVILLLLLVVPIALFQNAQARAEERVS